jgi:hypothetical protein
MILMFTYILIGCVVQLLIIVTRLMRGCFTLGECLDVNVLIGIVIGSIINIAVWPITIVAEIISIIIGI